jgi:hypothetical protein
MKPSAGRIVQYMLETHNGGLVIRPAVITRVGAALTDEADVGQVALSVFTAPEDRGHADVPLEAIERRIACEAPAEEWRAGTWRWPERT